MAEPTTPLRQRMIDDMRMRNNTFRTQFVRPVALRTIFPGTDEGLKWGMKSGSRRQG
jgi:hypothetical protein